jgi:hypothetical protein
MRPPRLTFLLAVAAFRPIRTPSVLAAVPLPAAVARTAIVERPGLSATFMPKAVASSSRTWPTPGEAP